MKTVDLHRQATAEMIEAARVYKERQEGLGFRFIRVVEEVCSNIGEFPEAGAPLGRKDRRRRVPRFPYDVVYRIKEDGSWSLPSSTTDADRATGSGAAIGSFCSVRPRTGAEASLDCSRPLPPDGSSPS